MASITIRTSFDTVENLTFIAKDASMKTFGTLNMRDGIISFIGSKGKQKKFKDESEFQKFVDKNDLTFMRPTKDGERWILYQPNPKKRNTGDCTIRAYTKAFDMSWDDAYTMAMRYGKEYGAPPNDAKVVDKILTEEFGFTCTKTRKCDGRMTVNEFAATHPKGTYLIKVYGHLVTIVDGFYYDTWDSGSKKVMAYYSK